MGSNLSEWIHLLARWFHLVAGISWIGTSFYFMWLDSELVAPKTSDGKATGELWLVHSGGYYHVVKNKITPGGLPETLHWFKWEAYLTWMSGIFLLTLIYYMGGGAYLLDPEVSSIGVGGATALGVSVLLGGWLAYDTLWSSRLAESHARLLTVACCAALVLVAFGLSEVLSGRAAYMHVGVLLGTLMVGNVWRRIIPAQRAMVGAAQRGAEPDHTLGEKAKLRSVHNNYMTFPLLAIMLSNHFPSTYGHKHNWLILAGLIVVGAGVRHFMNLRRGGREIVLLPVAAVLAALIMMTAPPGAQPAAPSESSDPKPSAGSTQAALVRMFEIASPVDSSVGAIRGVVRFEGAPPARKEIALPTGCSEHQGGSLVLSTVLAHDGRLQDAFVWIKKGLEGRTFPLPEGEVTISQRGCVFTPHVVGVRAGQRLTFVNDDSFLHNIDGASASNASFNEAMAGSARVTKVFANPETMLRVKCDVHPWMAASINVVAHPFFAVTGASGEVSFDGVPPGEYVLAASHETLGKASEKITVAPGKVTEVTFTFR